MPFPLSRVPSPGWEIGTCTQPEDLEKGESWGAGTLRQPLGLLVIHLSPPRLGGGCLEPQRSPVTLVSRALLLLDISSDQSVFLV